MFWSFTFCLVTICGLPQVTNGQGWCKQWCPCSGQCPNGWLEFGGSCYLISSSAKTWDEAQADCGRNAAFLAEVQTQSEIDFLKEKVLGRGEGIGFWLGGTDRYNEGSWVWATTGNAIRLSDWHRGEPNHLEAENCLEMRKNFGYEWNDLPCSYQQGYICKKLQR